MNGKTIFIIIVTVVITVFLMLNTDPVDFDFLFTVVPVSKLAIIGICTVAGFILGYMAGRPKTTISSYDSRFEENETTEEEADPLSPEDRDYIS